MVDEWRVQTVTTELNIFKSKENVESILNESLNQFKLDLKNTLSTMLNDLFKCPRHLVQQSVERTLKQMLKPFKRAFTQAQIYVGGNFDVFFFVVVQV